jgi:hypothetical protein
VSDLVSPNAQRDPQHLKMLHLLTHRCVKTRSTLLNVSKVKGRRIRDHLDMIQIAEISVGK